MGLRGCPFGCNFCSRPYGRTIRKRTPALIADEIQRDIERYGVQKIHFFDETFSVDRKHTLRLCQNLISRGLQKKIKWTCTVHANIVDADVAKAMKDSGCHYVGFGIESGDEHILQKMNKGITKQRIIHARKILKDAGITTMGFFLLGHPHESRSAMWRTIRFVAQLNTDVAAIGILVPYPGTETWELAIRGEGGYRKLSGDWHDYNKQLGNAVNLQHVSRREMEIYQILGYTLLYLLNFRFKDFYRTGRAHFFLAMSIVLKIIIPCRFLPKLMPFRNAGGRIYSTSSAHKSWG